MVFVIRVPLFDWGLRRLCYHTSDVSKVMRCCDFWWGSDVADRRPPKEESTSQPPTPKICFLIIPL
jgi:hypothetical protein